MSLGADKTGSPTVLDEGSRFYGSGSLPEEEDTKAEFQI